MQAKSFRLGLMGAVIALGVALVALPSDADAKRVGGSRSSGMKREAPTQPAQKAPAQQPDAASAGAAVPGAAAAPAAAAAAKAAPAAAQQAARRSWTGPLMGLAAGLGLAALFSSLGMGETFSSIMMMVLIGLVGFALLRFVLSRFGRGGNRQDSGLATASAGAASMGSMGSNTPSLPNPTMARTNLDGGSTAGASPMGGIRIGSALEPQAATVAADPTKRYLPADFDDEGFVRIAKTIFLRMQTANDERNLDDLRSFTTPEMFAELRADILERGDVSQRTEVVSVNPTIVDFVDEGSRQIVTVRYVGVIREEANAPSASYDEFWHLVREGSSPAWRIAGIQQVDSAA